VTRQALSAKSVRRYARDSGLPIIRMLARGGSHWILFVTADHRHGRLNSSTLEVQWQDSAGGDHWTSCATQLFPPGQAWFVCPRCGAASPNGHDVEQGYCGACHAWTGSERAEPA
jgi:hypothetical protein